MPKQLTERQAAGLWGDGGPYSEVRVTRQVRILDDQVSRTFHYVSAIINPTTFRLLKAMRKEIKDFQILECLDRAEYQSREGGYEWTMFGEESTSPAAANRAASELVQVIARMHRLVMEELGMTPPPTRGNA
ncbi:MAG: hypothetical protein ACE147_18050 [Candidatus Methylomirabilales bacterium]